MRYRHSTTISPTRTQNVPGDGKYDQSQIPSDLELQVGRADFANMPSFASTEQTLVKNYLDKDHDYRKKVFTATNQAVIDDNCGITKFYAIADTLAQKLQIEFINQVDESDTLDWDFKYKDQFLTLHYNVFNGVSIFPHEKKNIRQEHNAVMEVANFLQRSIF